jgi:hypothetical protein
MRLKNLSEKSALSGGMKYFNVAVNGLIYVKVYTHFVLTKAVLPKRFSNPTQFLEQQSIATYIALLDKK